MSKMGGNGAPQLVGENGPSLFTALQEQLGLKLKPEKDELKQLWLTTLNNLRKTKRTLPNPVSREVGLKARKSC